LRRSHPWKRIKRVKVRTEEGAKNERMEETIKKSNKFRELIPIGKEGYSFVASRKKR